MEEEIIHQPDHGGIALGCGREGLRVHREDLVHRGLQMTGLHVQPVDRLPDVPFRGGDKADRATNVLLHRIAGGHVQGVAQGHDQGLGFQAKRQGQVAQGQLPRNHLQDRRRHADLADILTLAFRALGHVGGHHPGIDKVQLPQNFGQGAAFAFGLPLGEIDLGGCGVAPDNQPLSQRDGPGGEAGGILRGIDPVHQPVLVDDHVHLWGIRVPLSS